MEDRGKRKGGRKMGEVGKEDGRMGGERMGRKSIGGGGRRKRIEWDGGGIEKVMGEDSRIGGRKIVGSEGG